MLHRSHRRAWLTLIVGGLLGVLAGPAWAEGKVTLKVAVIHATPAAKPADPALKNVQRSLEKAFGSRYKGFKQLDKAAFTLAQGQSADLKLPNDDAAKFTYEGSKDGKEHQLEFAVPAHKLDMTLRASLNKLFYQAGMRHGSGADKGILILALYLRAP